LGGEGRCDGFRRGNAANTSARQQNMLKLVGYWSECAADIRWIHPRLLVDPAWESENRPLIVDYLRRGVRLNEDLGYSFCRFQDGPPDSAMGNAELTDGVWIWPEGLAVYVEQFDTRLPEEFVGHMKRVDFEIPTQLSANELEKVPVDTTTWDAWCDAQR
jgi:hypothetical protein